MNTRGRLTRLLICAPILLLVMVPVGTLAAQEAPADTGAAPTPTSETVPPAFRSARATMETFLTSFYADDGADLVRAAECLDLSELSPAVRSLQGKELAGMLKRVIDRTRLVDLDSIPNDPLGDPWVFERFDDGSVVISRTAEGRWLFSSQTVASLWSVHDDISERDVVSGIEATGDVTTPAMWLRSKVPPPLRERLLFLDGWQWIGVLIVILAGFVAGRIFTAVAAGAVDRALAKRFHQIDKGLLIATIRPASVLLMVLLWGFGVLWLGLPTVIFKVYVEGIVVVAVIAFSIVAYRLIDVVSALGEAYTRETDSRFDDLLVPLIRKSVKVLVVAIGLVTVAGSVGIEVAGLLAGLGLGGLAFALAAQDTVSNLFGSITVLLDRPFQVGDWIVVGDVEGTVEEMGFRSTRVRTFYNSLITLPNSNLIKASVDNLGARSYRRWSTRMGIAYDTPPEKVDAFCAGIRELIERHPYTRKDYFHVYFNEFGAASLEILLYVFFAAPDWATELRERHRLAVDILRLAHELGVEFAFPTQTVYLRNEEWSAPELAGAGYPEVSRKDRTEARAAARRLVDDALGGRVPPPVQFPVPPEEEGGDGGE
ncbi:MAG: mechanosensitive ion channel domain-containing protein [Thermoanaerobaculales bacterium]|nr:mechanosensitive ion channel domain-containing protein [Thermoanaerobaculales bacterium]